MKTRNIIIKSLTIAALFGLQSLQATYTGVSVGHMMDANEEIILARIGGEFAANSSGLSHRLEFEIGYVDYDEMGVGIEVIPVMFNYKAVNTAPDKMDIYIGFGAGMSKVDVSGYGLSDDDTVFTAQAMVGLEINMSSASAFRLGYRYIYLDKIEMFGVKSDDDMDDHIAEIGFVFKF